MIGLVFGLGFVLSFGYWTTNFVEVQRAMASSSISAAQRAPIIGAFPKMFIPFIVILPGMIAGGHRHRARRTRRPGPRPDYNNSILYLIRDLLPNGMLGIAIAGLLASFMAGMAANISAFNTVFSYDLWQTYVKKDRDDSYYTRVGRLATVAATLIAIGTAMFALQLLQHHGLPADAVRVLQRPAVRHLHPRHVLEADDRHGRLDRAGQRHRCRGPGRASSARTPSGGLSVGAHPASRARAPASSRPARRSSSTSWSASLVTQVTAPKPESELRGLVYSLTPKADFHDEDEGVLAWCQQPNKLAGVALVMVIVLNIIFW